ncbi:uncharacterized protein LOC108845122 [Raphanus sativus]|uniref:Uncharacterized protein LOC108845122 n=1 Tax=Raphanus sativus TaxID=3726 RepID=A0A6J0MN06_RAPSA|nr:uncharacterized protein LOC108845122 [Raphanus sativus]
MKQKFSFKLYKVTKTLVVAKCCVAECGWKFRASVKHGTNTFWVTKYLKTHTCLVSDRVALRKHSTPKYVGKLFINRIGIIDGLNPKHIKDAMKNMFGMTLDCTNSYRALLYVQELVRGTAEDGYEWLPSYMEQIKLANPGSITSIELDDKDRFKYPFLASGASIIDGEDDESWEWFFTKLSSCISNQHALVIVSNWNAAIKNACDKVFPWAIRGTCYYHLQQNIVQRYKGKYLLYLVKAAYVHTVYDFDRYMEEIRSANPALATYLEKADVRLWSRVHCHGDMYNLKTSNIAESINSALKPARGFPIYFLLEFIREKVGRWYWKRREDALTLTCEHSQGVERLLAIRSEIADTMSVQPIDGWKFFVTGGRRNCIVDLEHIKCECGVFGIEKICCSHAIAAGTFAKVHIASLVSPLYSRENLHAGYSHNIYPCAGEVEIRKCLPPDVKHGPGRQKKSRWQSWLELSRFRGHKPQKLHKDYSFSNCKQPGHTRPNCNQPVQ